MSGYYGLKRPCAKCPFRTDVKPFIRHGRAIEIVQMLERSEFACHETTVDTEDDDGYGECVEGPHSQHCAGALIMLEKAGQPSQMMRICERLRGENGRPMYDAAALDMSAPVYDSPEAFVEAHRASAPKKRRRNVDALLDGDNAIRCMHPDTRVWLGRICRSSRRGLSFHGAPEVVRDQLRPYVRVVEAQREMVRPTSRGRRLYKAWLERKAWENRKEANEE
jgi:hypothetical protein